ncbi:arylsulfatase [Prevotella intermedia ATCC 25611 = DSM 20706]|uniref:LTA synthase family protein n=1 Tax=Prevotella intermedia TaxID=28131 RepID=UPI0003F6DB65|nr:LTA synthase family protein [Prevotella intermedia]APW32356.1 arylsulfatase [Prevotella intermedia ATCC 25611 = DSM 20706]
MMNYFAAKLTEILKHTLVIVSIFFIVRLLFAVCLVPFTTFEAYAKSLPFAAFNALRFDLQVAAYVAILPFLVVLVCLFVRNRSVAGRLSRFISTYYVVLEIALLILALVDIGFYSNFHSHINITFFDFFNENPLSLLQTIWEEYHVILYLSAVCLASFVIYILAQKIAKGTLNCENKQESLAINRKTIVLIVLFLVAEVVCLRGSVWRFPLQVEDSFVSSSKQINDLVPNAAYMLKKAMKEKKNAFAFRSIGSLLSEYKFKSLQEAINVYTNSDTIRLQGDTLAALRTALFRTVPDTMTHKQPNVLIIYEESWSNYLMNLDTPRCDMLLGMRRHLKEDLLFRNFQSVGNGTIASIENIVSCVPFPRFFSSPYRFHCLPSSVALPFNESGYTTEFISGMDVAWENCAEALKHQQFKKVTGKFTLKEQHPEYEYNSIGVFDHHLFRSIQEQLDQHTAKPQMMLCMTTTNHPPFEFPKDVQLKAVPDDYYNNVCFAEKNHKVLQKYITGFRYANKTLGDFLDKFKQSKAAENTIVIISGDHNVRSIIDYTQVNKRWERSVPLYIYLPPYLRKESHRSMTNRWGSHDDILATLAPFAFRNTKYMCLGNNLLKEGVTDSTYYSANVEQLLACPAYQAQAQRIVSARNLLRIVFFQQIFAKY